MKNRYQYHKSLHDDFEHHILIYGKLIKLVTWVAAPGLSTIIENYCEITHIK